MHAQERAREAGLNAAHENDRWREIADAASAVWKPLVQEAHDYLQHHDDGYCGYDTTERSQLIDKLKEALG